MMSFQRTDIGKYSTNGYHRITGAMGANFPFPYNDPPIAITPGPQNITYTSYHQPASISETVNSTPYLLEYTYDADQQRNYSKLRNMNNPCSMMNRPVEGQRLGETLPSPPVVVRRSHRLKVDGDHL